MDKGTRNGQDEENPEFKNFQRLLEQALSVPKEKIDEKRAEYEWEKKTRKQPR